ncbi:MAG TPA: amidohydrolase family protein [Bryobacteraceae bacterium]|nr:amidohydrolase family protein [Bryobacteraceae bacterium]
MNRRTFLATSAAVALQQTTEAAASMPIIDCHIHLFDVSRPQGVPWPPKNDPVLYKTASIERYRKIAVPLGIVGAIEVEASPWLEDNQWVLDIAAKDKILVGTVGDLEPDKPDFRQQLERFHKNPLFRGIRYGNLWDRDFTAAIGKPEFISGLKLLAQADLVMDTANPDPKLIADLVRLTDKVPSLRIVVDHLPRLVKPKESAALKQYEANLRTLAARKQVYFKVSGVVRKVNGKAVEDPAFYKPFIDEMFDLFGEDRLIYGSDWPNSDTWAEYPVELKIVRAYFDAKGKAAAEKYFWRNSVAAYKWIRRTENQPKA